MRGRRRAIALWLGLGLWLACALAWGQGQGGPALSAGDYGLENREWNGLSQFLSLARSQGVKLQPVTELDWSQLGPQDRLIVLYPTGQVDTDEFARFVIDGGRAVLADDFGASGNLLRRLGIERLDASRVQHDSFYLNRPGLPVFQPGGRHPLLQGVQEVVANHPAALVTEGGAVLPFDAGDAGLVYDMRLGRGKAIVLGDASLLINHMIGIKDNRLFLRNTLDYLCVDADPCEPYLLVGDARLVGGYQAQNTPQSDLGEWFEEGLDGVNGFLERLADGLPGRTAMYYASLLLLLGTVAFMVTVFPWRKALRVAPQVGPPTHIRPLSEFEWNLLRFERSGFQANYILPLAILRVEFERLFFTSVLGPQVSVPPPGDAQREPFLRRATQSYTDGLALPEGKERVKVYRRTHQLLQMFGRIPPRHRLFLDSEVHVTERELARIHRQCMEILESLGVKQEYERRTRNKG